MSSNHLYIHSLSYREAQGFKMSEGGLTTRTYPLEGASTSQAGGVQATLHLALYGDSGVWRTRGRWTLGGEKKKGMVSTFA